MLLLFVYIVPRLCGLCHSRDHLQFDRDRRGQAVDLDGGPARRIMLEVFLPKPVVHSEIRFHVRQENGDVDDVLPAAASFFQDPAHILENASALGLYVIARDVPIRIQFHSWDLLASTLSWTHSAKEEQIPNTACMWIMTNWFRGPGTVYRTHATKVVNTWDDRLLRCR